MGGNSISRLDGNSFRGMRFMRRLYFENNQISAIGRQTFQNLRQGGGGPSLFFSFPLNLF
jgi:hypothetical protein